MHPLSTAGQPLILFLRRFLHMISLVRASGKTLKRHFFDSLEGAVDICFFGRIVLLAPNFARPRLAAPPGAPTRPARGMSGFWIRQVILNNCSLISNVILNAAFIMFPCMAVLLNNFCPVQIHKLINSTGERRLHAIVLKLIFAILLKRQTHKIAIDIHIRFDRC